MRIGFVFSYVADNDPLGVYALQMAKQLSAIADIHLIGIGNAPKQEFDAELSMYISRHEASHYEHALYYINQHCDICFIHHHHQAFGLYDGQMVLPFVAGLKKPVVTLFHQLNHNPSAQQQMIVSSLGNYSVASVVMSMQSVEVLEHIYKVPRERIRLIEYGLIDWEPSDREALRHKHNLWGKQVILAVGELTPSSGIHQVIEALSSLRVKLPNIVFKHIGITHPYCLNAEGQEYRTSVNMLVRKLGLSDYVILDNICLTDIELMEQLTACDVFVEPVTDDDCLHSASLVKALAAGSAIVSNSFWHAQELLSDNRGEMCAFNQMDILSERLAILLHDERRLAVYRQSARDLGQHYAWSKVIPRYQKVFDEVVDNQILVKESRVDFQLLVSLHNKHLSRLVSQNGIIGQSCFGVTEGESNQLKDNALALMAFAARYRHLKDDKSREDLMLAMSALNRQQHQWASRYVSVESVENEDIAFCIAALGYFIRMVQNTSQREWARGIIIKAFPLVNVSSSTLSLAFVLSGLIDLLMVFPSEDNIYKHVKELHLSLNKLLAESQTSEWGWFENIFTANTAVHALALMKTSLFLNDAVALKTSTEQAAFIIEKAFEEGFYLSLTGRSKVKTKVKRTDLEQTAIDTIWMGLLCREMAMVNRQTKWMERAFQCYLWFLGENSLRKPLYHAQTGAVSNSIRGNQVSVYDGAQGTFSFAVVQMMAYEMFCCKYAVNTVED
jgi:glycosyltransferase involved in cell wall biosynthesis